MSAKDRAREIARRLALGAGRLPAPRPNLPPPASDPRQPCWAPDSTDLEFVPPDSQRVLSEVVLPAYEQFVLSSTDGLERWIGSTLVHLLWLETLHQLDLKRDYATFSCVPELSRIAPSEITNQLRLIESKMKIGGFLLRIREMRQRLGDLAEWPLACVVPLPAAPPPPPALPCPSTAQPEQVPSHPTGANQKAKRKTAPRSTPAGVGRQNPSSGTPKVEKADSATQSRAAPRRTKQGTGEGRGRPRVTRRSKNEKPKRR